MTAYTASAIPAAPAVASASAAGLALPALEQVYDQLADAIDQVGPERTERLLVKLALLLAQANGDPAVFTDCLQRARRED